MIWSDLILPIIVLGCIVALLIVTAIYAPILYSIAKWIAIIVASLILLILLSVFIHWLFIEPFKNKKEDNQ